MVKFGLARLDAIEAQIKALESEYRAIYQLLIGAEDMRHKIEYGEEKICEECGKIKPISEFYSSKRHGETYYMRKCRECERIHRSLVAKGKTLVGSEITIGRPSRKKKKETNTDRINNTQIEAAASGMSYGQYVAMQYSKREKELRALMKESEK